MDLNLDDDAKETPAATSTPVASEVLIADRRSQRKSLLPLPPMPKPAAIPLDFGSDHNLLPLTRFGFWAKCDDVDPTWTKKDFDRLLADVGVENEYFVEPMLDNRAYLNFTDEQDYRKFLKRVGALVDDATPKLDDAILRGLKAKPCAECIFSKESMEQQRRLFSNGPLGVKERELSAMMKEKLRDRLKALEAQRELERQRLEAQRQRQAQSQHQSNQFPGRWVRVHGRGRSNFRGRSFPSRPPQCGGFAKPYFDRDQNPFGSGKPNVGQGQGGGDPGNVGFGKPSRGRDHRGVDFGKPKRDRNQLGVDPGKSNRDPEHGDDSEKLAYDRDQSGDAGKPNFDQDQAIDEKPNRSRNQSDEKPKRDRDRRSDGSGHGGHRFHGTERRTSDLDPPSKRFRPSGKHFHRGERERSSSQSSGDHNRNGGTNRDESDRSKRGDWKKD